MKILMMMQKAVPDDPILGLFCEWVKALAAEVEQLTVIALEAREDCWPSNVEIISLGKDKGVNRLGRFKKLFSYANNQLAAKNFDLIFCHMCPSYLIFLSPWAKALHIPLTMWYAHGHVSSSLKLALKLADQVFTSTRQGFRLTSPKVTVIGQGIPTAWFDCPPAAPKGENETINIVNIGRISSNKDQMTFLKMAALIVENRLIAKPKFFVVGGILTSSDQPYLDTLQDFSQKKGLTPYVEFVPACPPQEILSWYKRGDVFVNTSKTGSLDKVIVEAMAAGKPIITSNEAGIALVKSVNQLLTFASGDYMTLTKNLVSICELDPPARENLTAKLRMIVEKEHNLTRLMKKLTTNFKQLTKS